MITEYLPQPIYFSNISEDKYKDCLTRDEYKSKLQEKSRILGGDIVIPELSRDLSKELFCGDKIVGIYVHPEDGQHLCLYEWKRNNPTEIRAYCILDKFKLKEKVGDVELLTNDDLYNESTS